MFQEEGSVPVLADLSILRGMGAGLVFQLCGCCCLTRLGKDFITGNASAALVRFTGENITEWLVTLICLSCLTTGVGSAALWCSG